MVVEMAIHRSISAFTDRDKVVTWLCGDCDRPVNEENTLGKDSGLIRFLCPTYGHLIAEWKDEKQKQADLSLYWDVVNRSKKKPQELPDKTSDY